MMGGKLLVGIGLVASGCLSSAQDGYNLPWGFPTTNWISHSAKVVAVAALCDGTATSISTDQTARKWANDGKNLICTATQRFQNSLANGIGVFQGAITRDGSGIAVAAYAAPSDCGRNFGVITGSFFKAGSFSGVPIPISVGNVDISVRPRGCAAANNAVAKGCQFALSNGSTVFLMDQDRKIISDVKLPGGSLQANTILACSSQGDKVAAVLQNSTAVNLIDVATQKVTTIEFDKKDRVRAMSFSQGKLFAAFGRTDSSEVSLQFLEPGAKSFNATEVRFKPASVVGISLSVGKTKCALALWDARPEVRIFDLANPKVATVYPMPSEVTALCISEDDSHFAAGMIQGQVAVAECTNPKSQLFSELGIEPSKAVPFWSSDSIIAWSGPQDHLQNPENLVAGIDFLNLSDLGSEPLRAVTLPRAEDVVKLFEESHIADAYTSGRKYSFQKVSENQNCFVTADWPGPLFISSGTNYAVHPLGVDNDKAASVAVSPDKKWIAVTYLNGLIKFFDLSDPRLLDIETQTKIAPKLTYARFTSGDWVIWSPTENYYFGTAKAEESFGFQLQSPSGVEFVPARNMPQFRSAEQIKRIFNRQPNPDPFVRTTDNLAKIVDEARDDLNVEVLSADDSLSRVAEDSDQKFITKNASVSIQLESDKDIKKTIPEFDPSNLTVEIQGAKDDASAIVLQEGVVKLQVYPGINRFQVIYPKNAKAGEKVFRKVFEIKCESDSVEFPELMVFDVGISKYATLKELPGCKSDQSKIQTFFESRGSEVMLGGTGDTLLRKDFLAKLDQFISKVQANPKAVDAVLYLSAHGAIVEGKEPLGLLATSDYVKPADGKSYDPNVNGGVSWSEIFQKIGSVKSKKQRRYALILDACHSGSSAFAAQAGANLSDQAAKFSLCYFASSKPAELSYATPEGSNFTTELLKILESTDRNRSNTSLNSLYSPVYDQVRNIQSTSQTPYFYAGPALGTAGEIVLKRR